VGETFLHSAEDNEGGPYIGSRSHSTTQETRYYCNHRIWQSNLE
jgi:hypothetical protein